MRRSRQELSRAIEESCVDAYATFFTACPKAILRHERDMILYASGAPVAMMNGVLAPRFSAESMARRTEEALSFFRERGLPMTFTVGPSCTPPGLDDHLQSVGLVPEPVVPGMAIDLDVVGREPLPTGFEISAVEDMASFGACARIFAEVFGEGDREATAWRHEYALGFGVGPTRRWFLGRLNGRPVAISVLMLHKGVAGVYAVATIEEARGRGIGTAMTREPLLVAKDLGYDFAVLQASEMGLPLYAKMGFEEYCKIRMYIWSPK